MGPACSSKEQILALIDAGMNGARLNFSHGTHEEHREVIARLKWARAQKGVPLAIILDTKGPEIRVGQINPPGLSLKAGDRLFLTKEAVIGSSKRISITPTLALDYLKPGVIVLFDDGYISSKVIGCTGTDVEIQIENGGVLKSHKGVNIPNVDIPLPAMTEQDIADIAFGCAEGVDIIAASFIRSAEHILAIKQHLAEHGRPDILVMAKIENSLGVRAFDEIVEVADGIMIARGDLGVELPLDQVPKLQKMMIRKCCEQAKPVVTATQMLESMIHNPRPTRAEVSDVANAIYDSTSAVMLSGETAIGKYPIESAKMMKSIALETEKDFNYSEFFGQRLRQEGKGVCISTAVALATVKTAYSVHAKVIMVFTSRGYTSRLVSHFRPQMPILALTSQESVYHQLAIIWGVIPVNPMQMIDMRDAFLKVGEFACHNGWAAKGDLVVVTAGTPFGVSGTTNMLLVEIIPR